MKIKRWVAALLCVLLIGSLFPVSAMAEDEPDPVYYITVTPGDGSGEAFTVNSVDNKGDSLLF